MTIVVTYPSLSHTIMRPNTITLNNHDDSNSNSNNTNNNNNNNTISGERNSNTNTILTDQNRFNTHNSDGTNINTNTNKNSKIDTKTSNNAKLSMRHSIINDIAANTSQNTIESNSNLSNSINNTNNTTNTNTSNQSNNNRNLPNNAKLTIAPNSTTNMPILSLTEAIGTAANITNNNNNNNNTNSKLTNQTNYQSKRTNIHFDTNTAKNSNSSVMMPFTTTFGSKLDTTKNKKKGNTNILNRNERSLLQTNHKFGHKTGQNEIRSLTPGLNTINNNNNNNSNIIRFSSQHSSFSSLSPRIVKYNNNKHNNNNSKGYKSANSSPKHSKISNRYQTRHNRHQNRHNRHNRHNKQHHNDSHTNTNVHNSNRTRHRRHSNTNIMNKEWLQLTDDEIEAMAHDYCKHSKWFEACQCFGTLVFKHSSKNSDASNEISNTSNNNNTNDNNINSNESRYHYHYAAVLFEHNNEIAKRKLEMTFANSSLSNLGINKNGFFNHNNSNSSIIFGSIDKERLNIERIDLYLQCFKQLLKAIQIHPFCQDYYALCADLIYRTRKLFHIKNWKYLCDYYYTRCIVINTARIISYQNYGIFLQNQLKLLDVALKIYKLPLVKKIRAENEDDLKAQGFACSLLSFFLLAVYFLLFLLYF